MDAISTEFQWPQRDKWSVAIHRLCFGTRIKKIYNSPTLFSFTNQKKGKNNK